MNADWNPACPRLNPSNPDLEGQAEELVDCAFCRSGADDFYSHVTAGPPSRRAIGGTWEAKPSGRERGGAIPQQAVAG